MNRRGTKAFSLVEMLVALMIVGTIVEALATVIPMSLRGMNRGQTGVTAQNLARQYMDWWQQQDFATLQACCASDASEVSYVDPLPVGAPLPLAPSPQQYGSLAPSVPGPTFYTHVLFGSTDPNVIQVDVFVDWQAGGLAGFTTTAAPGGLGAGTSEVHYSTCVYNVTSPW